MQSLKITSSIFLYNLISISLICSSCTATFFDDRFHLQITNDMGQGRALKANCSSNNHEVNERELQFGETMSMELKDELFDRTQVECDFSGLGSGPGSGVVASGHFRVFVEGETGYSCGEVCEYSARVDGLWFYDFRDAEWEFKGAWVRVNEP